MVFFHINTFSYSFGSPHLLDGAEKSLHDALCVLSQTVNDGRVLLGGGWPDMVMAKAVDELAKKTPGKGLMQLRLSPRHFWHFRPSLLTMLVWTVLSWLPSFVQITTRKKAMQG